MTHVAPNTFSTMLTGRWEKQINYSAISQKKKKINYSAPHQKKRDGGHSLSKRRSTWDPAEIQRPALHLGNEPEERRHITTGSLPHSPMVIRHVRVAAATVAVRALDFRCR